MEHVDVCGRNYRLEKNTRSRGRKTRIACGITVFDSSFDQRSISRIAFILGTLELNMRFLPLLCLGFLFPAILLAFRTLLIYSYPLTLSGLCAIDYACAVCVSVCGCA